MGMTRQGPHFSIRMVIGIFCSDTVFDTVFVQLNQFSQILSRQCCLESGRVYNLDKDLDYNLKCDDPADLDELMSI